MRMKGCTASPSGISMKWFAMVIMRPIMLGDLSDSFMRIESEPAMYALIDGTKTANVEGYSGVGGASSTARSMSPNNIIITIRGGRVMLMMLELDGCRDFESNLWVGGSAENGEGGR